VSFGAPYFTLPEFTYHKPKTLREALELLEKHGEEAKVMAGGVGLIAFMKERLMAPSHVVDIKSIPELKSIEHKEGEGLSIGAAVTLDEVASTPLVRERFTALHDAARNAADAIIRRRATLVGNLCEAIPWVDSPPALIALGAEVEVASIGGGRRIPVERFIKGPVEIDLNPGELVVRVRVPDPPKQARSMFIKYNAGSEFALVNVAGYVVFDGVVKDVRLVYGAIGPTPQRASKAEEVLKRNGDLRDLITEAAEVASDTLEPSSDVLASEEYRRHIIKTITVRILRELVG